MSRASRHARPDLRNRPAARLLRLANGRCASPLARPLDRARARLVVLAGAWLVVAALLSVGAGLLDLHSGQRRADLTTRHLHRLEGVLLTSAVALPEPFGPTLVDRSGYRAKVSWTFPAGQPHTAVLPVPAHAAAGSTTTILVADQGRPVPAPPTGTELATDAAVTGLLTLGALTLLIGAALRLRLSLLDRRAAASWQRGWAEVEPIWSGRSTHRP
ncbi:Rv1733c family protein [Kitasatospora sp. LaBMicrA B282]|uniref:Rv1733c family protein n=1 Tax=Kitasatospora sp. LaBMicrA B282 TaxID=3420949 RepID=UPI003D10FDC2